MVKVPTHIKQSTYKLSKKSRSQIHRKQAVFIFVNIYKKQMEIFTPIVNTG